MEILHNPKPIFEIQIRPYLASAFRAGFDFIWQTDKHSRRRERTSLN